MMMSLDDVRMSKRASSEATLLPKFGYQKETLGVTVGVRSKEMIE